jgi:hypothetical protein
VITPQRSQSRRLVQHWTVADEFTADDPPVVSAAYHLIFPAAL